MLNMISQQLSSSGGPVLVALFVVSLVSITIAIFKAVQFSRMGVGRTRGVDGALDTWVRGDLGRAAKMACADVSPGAVVVTGAMVSLLDHPADRDRARDVAAHLALRQLSVLSKHLRFLETVAQAAPMLGLLGTVIGMISAFGELSSKGGAIDPSALAGGIWVALITTAAGLTVAIPVYFLSMWFEARIDNERASMEAAIARVLLSVRTPETTEPRMTAPVAMPKVTYPATAGG